MFKKAGGELGDFLNGKSQSWSVKKKMGKMRKTNTGFQPDKKRGPSKGNGVF